VLTNLRSVLVLWARNKPKKTYRKRCLTADFKKKALNSAFFCVSFAKRPIVKEKLTGVLLNTSEISFTSLPAKAEVRFVY
jgi:hypothetical protein